ncbi:TetR/AcrR family transcriptional regulator [Hyphomicrobium sp.]|uniref:TetR/AcrR family transcriptional regulator n=1 Tax=Hyphomicrobium sp. TaxID=82 RepID=UPI002FDCD9AD
MSKTLADRRRKSDAGEAALPPRERILAVSCDLFYRHGVHAVGVELIAEAAQTNKMTLYRHFKSKDELIVAYARRLAAEGEAVWERLAVAFPDDPERRLAAWVDHVEEILTSSAERGCALANAAVELQPSHPARTVIEDYKRRKREQLVGLFAQSRYRNPELLADEVFLLFEGARISIQCGGRGPALRVVEMLRDLLAGAPRDI